MIYSDGRDERSRASRIKSCESSSRETTVSFASRQVYVGSSERREKDIAHFDLGSSDIAILFDFFIRRSRKLSYTYLVKEKNFFFIPHISFY